MHIRRHHLIEEAKAELDVAYEEVRRAENRLVAIDMEYGDRIVDAQHQNGELLSDALDTLLAERDMKKAKVDVVALYHLEKAAIERFSILTAAFSSVCMYADDEDAVKRIARYVFRPKEFEEMPKSVHKAVRDFVRGLRSYTTEDASPDNDRLVREAWDHIEATLRGLGRTI